MKSINIVNMAINVEKQGEFFYKELAKVVNKKFTDTLLELAEQEKQHAEVFIKLADTKEWDEIDSYISSYASVYIIPDLERIVESFDKRNLNSIFELAIEIEKDSIILYYELKEQVNDNDIKNLIKKIIEQEKSHIKKIIEMKNNF
ncbi:ferritin-like domain-containing protein [Thermosipho atlanticus]|uniref:Rubrerythrin n=1 Tax=Thermosipho atlanticus DSM 15807 TaxID=1123380 RepID=A0A1M5S4K6_9BACT|nr:ferritin family protein [Thermosipho atlanticus]SHH33416.1 Rubrerythrin [Thermosipho atlanticus DSM 15807]